MKDLFRDRNFLFAALLVLCTTVLYVIHKTDAFTLFRFIHYTTILYGVWFLTISYLAYRSYMTSHHVMHRIWAFCTGFFPSAVTLCLTPFFFDTHIHQEITILIGFYFIFYGFLFVYTHHKKHHVPQKSHDQIPRSHLLLILATACIYLFFGIDHLGKAFYVDEKLWIYDRIETYWDNIVTGDWYNTRPSDKPGVTTAIISGPSLLFFDPSDFAEGSLYKDQLENMFFTMRLPLFVSVFLCLVIVYFFSRKILTPATAVIFFILLSLSPLLLGIARMINPDAILWILFLLSFLSFMHYLFNRSLPALYCAGIFLGLSLLTKYIANIFIVFFFLIILFDPIIRRESYADITQTLRERLTQFGIMIFIALSVFYVLYPGTWVKHDRLLLATIHSEAFVSTWLYFATFLLLLCIDIFLYRARITSAIIDLCSTYRKWFIYCIISVFILFISLTLINVYTGMSLFDYTYIIESPKSVYRDVGPLALFSASFYPLIFGVTPLVLVGLVSGIFHVVRAKKWSTSHMMILYSMIFILMYYAGSIINNVMPIVRYQIVLYPLMILMASIGWTTIASRFTKRSSIVIAFCVIALFCESIQLYRLNNYYFSYNNPLLPQKYIINSKDMGDGNYEIAQYLNTLPDAHNTLIWTDKTGLCQFFVGSCNNMIQDMSLVEIAPEIDHYVVTQNRQGHIERLTQQKIENDPNYPIRLDRLYASDLQKEFEILPGNRSAQFIRVIRSEYVDTIDN